MLQPNDIVVYLTVKNKWDAPYPHYRLVAILEVIKKSASHAEAASWYRSQALPIPSNCMVLGNEAHPFDETAGDYENVAEVVRYMESNSEKRSIVGRKRVELWDKSYLAKSKKWPEFIITQAVFCNLYNPPIIKEDDVINIFGRTINTRTPPSINKSEFKQLATFADIDFISVE
jgi:hypothetical protein